MKGPRKLTPEETLKALEISAEADAAMREVLAMSKEELDQDLESAGFDPAEQSAKAAARRAKLLALAAGTPAVAVAVAATEPAEAPVEAPPEPRLPAPSPAEPVRRLPPRRRSSRYLLLAAALVAVAAAAAIALWPPRPPVPSLVPRPPVTAPAPPPKSSLPQRDEGPDIALLRRDAVDACKQTRWEACLAGLDLARRYDPAGETDPLVALARQQATLALEGGDAADRENAKSPPGPAPRGK